MYRHILIGFLLILVGCTKANPNLSQINESFSLKEHLVKGDQGSECTLPDVYSIEQYKPIIDILANTRIKTPSDKLQRQLLGIKTTNGVWKTAERDDVGNVQGYTTKAIMPIRPLGSRTDISSMIVFIKYDKFELISGIQLTSEFGLNSDRQKVCVYQLLPYKNRAIAN